MAVVLVVDDEKEIADLVEVYLLNESYSVFKATSVKEAWRFLQKGKIDLAILDVMLPDGSGFALCQQIREKYTFPIIMLTAKEGDMDKITGLTLGADDYITKPFKPLELVARIKAQLRRYTKYNTPSSPDHIFAHKGLTLNADTHTCTLDGSPVSLTPTEFSILKILCEQKGKVVSSEELYHAVCGDAYFIKNSNTITTHIRHLREKLRDSAERPKYIKTIWGVGYKIET